MEPPQVIAEGMLDRGAVVGHVKQEMLLASGKIREGAARVRQDHLQVGILIERAGVNKLGREESVLDGGIDAGGERRRPGGAVAAVGIGHAIHLVKDDRQVQRLDAREDRREVWIEDVIVAFDGIGQVHGAHAGLAGDAVQFLQREFGISTGSSMPTTKRSGYFWWT